jgi:hypothetical protein
MFHVTKFYHSPLLITMLLSAATACKPDLNALKAGGGNAGEAGASGSSSGGHGGTGGKSSSGGASTGTTEGGTSGQTGGSSAIGGTSAAGGTTNSSTNPCEIAPFVPGDPPALKYDFDTAGADGTHMGQTGWTPSGRIGGALVLGDNQYVQMPADVIKAYEAVTIASWVKLSANPSGSTLFDIGSSDTNHLYLRTNGGTGIAFGAQVNGGSVQEAATTYAFPLGVWKHVALVIGDGKGSLYIDGLNVASQKMTFTPSALQSTSGNYIGHSLASTTSIYASIDDFRIYGRALTREEVEFISPPGSDYVHFRFDEPCGAKGFDRSSKAWTAELPSGGTWTSSGRIGGGLTLDGSSQYVKLPDNVLQSCAGDFTMAMWVQRQSSSSWERLFSVGTSVTTFMSFTPATSGGVMQFAAKLNGTELRGVDSGEQQVTSTSASLSPQRGIWGHVAVVLKGGTGYLYYDGQQAASGPVTIKPSDLGATTINEVGRPLYSSEPFFNGTIDDLRISCRAYSPQEVKLLAIAN